MYGHNFGLKAAVLSFNRHTQLLSWAAKALFGVCNAAYFDDVDITEPSYCGSTGKHVIHKLAELAGTPFASEKDTPFATARVFLGVTCPTFQTSSPARSRCGPSPEGSTDGVSAISINLVSATC